MFRRWSSQHDSLDHGIRGQLAAPVVADSRTAACRLPEQPCPARRLRHHRVPHHRLPHTAVSRAPATAPPRPAPPTAAPPCPAPPTAAPPCPAPPTAAQPCPAPPCPASDSPAAVSTPPGVARRGSFRGYLIPAIAGALGWSYETTTSARSSGRYSVPYLSNPGIHHCRCGGSRLANAARDTRR